MHLKDTTTPTTTTTTSFSPTFSGRFTSSSKTITLPVVTMKSDTVLSASTVSTTTSTSCCHEKDNQNVDLRSLHQTIIQQTNSLCSNPNENWPSLSGSEYMLHALDYNIKQDCYEPTIFDNEQGPIGMMALINEQYNHHGLHLVHTLLDVFQLFSTELMTLVKNYDTNNNNNNNEDNNKDIVDHHHVYVLPTLVPHITLAVFMEHPKILIMNSIEEKNWQPIPDEIIQSLQSKLNEAIFIQQQQRKRTTEPAARTITKETTTVDGCYSAEEEYLSANHLDDSDNCSIVDRGLEPSNFYDDDNDIDDCCSKMILELDSIILTPDGAMIACFIEKRITLIPSSSSPGCCCCCCLYDHCHPFQHLKRTCLETATKCLSPHNYPLSSRPKRLIHITLGRILSIIIQKNNKNHSNKNNNNNSNNNIKYNNNNNNHNTNHKSNTNIDIQLNEQIKQLVTYYNQVVLPQKVRDICNNNNKKKNHKNDVSVLSQNDVTKVNDHGNNEHHSSGCFTVTDTSLLRNQVWLCVDNIIYQTWKF